MLRFLRRRGVVAGVVCGVVAMALGGCHREGNWPAASLDKHTYVSRSWEPKTITLMDTRTGEPAWSVDIPVGQQLVVGFSKGTGPNEYKPDEIVWEVMAAGKNFGKRNNRQACPPSYARRLDMLIRSTPESVWTREPGSPSYRPEPRPVRRAGGRVVEPIEDAPSTLNAAPGGGTGGGMQPQGEPYVEEPAPELEPVSMEPEPIEIPAAPATEVPVEEPPIELPDEPAPVPTGGPDYQEVPTSSEPARSADPEDPPIDIPD